MTVLLKALARDEAKGHSSSSVDCPSGRREKEKLRKQVGVEEVIVQSTAGHQPRSAYCFLVVSLVAW